MILLRIWNVFFSGTVAVLLYRDMKKTQKIKEIENTLQELIRDKEIEKLRLELPDDYIEDSVDETTGEENPNLIYGDKSTRTRPLAAAAPEEPQAEPENTHSSETSSDGWKEVKSEEEPDEMKLSPSISQEDLVPIED